MLAALKVLLAVALVGTGLPAGAQTRTGGINTGLAAFTGLSAPASPGSAWEIYDEAPDVAADALLAAKGGVKELSHEAQRGIRSLEKQITKHEKKLADFKANPTVRPGMEGQPKEVIEAAQQSRIRHLEKEIQTFRENIKKLQGGE